MTHPPAFLAAKRSADDRAIDREVWDRFESGLAERTAGPVRLLDAGTGLGTMAVRLADWMTLPTRVVYHGVDVDDTAIVRGRAQLPGWLRDCGYRVEWEGDTLVATAVDGGIPRLEVTLEARDVVDVEGEADAVIAAAFMDIVDPKAMLGTFDRLLAPRGLLYAPLTFDGRTRFRPIVEGDREVERLYHRHMDEIRDCPGSSRAGEGLLEQLPAAGFDVLADGIAHWKIQPTDGGYPAEEETVLAHLIETIEGALADYPPKTLATDVRREWIETRRTQLANRRLSARIRHRDVLARRRG